MAKHHTDKDDYLLELNELIKQQPKYPNNESSDLINASSSNNFNLVQSLIESGKVNINETNDGGRVNALLISIYHKNNTIAKYLIEKGADIHYINKVPYADTALHWACYYGNEEMVKILLELGANYEIKNHSGVTPIDDSKKYGNIHSMILKFAEESKRKKKNIFEFKSKCQNNNIYKDLSIVITGEY
ncbi:hypothetical protein ABK040_005804 [Willaertia magna]